MAGFHRHTAKCPVSQLRCWALIVWKSLFRSLLLRGAVRSRALEVLGKEGTSCAAPSVVTCAHTWRPSSLPPVSWSVKSVTIFLLYCQRQTLKRASLRSPSQQQKLWNWHSSRSHLLHRKRFITTSTNMLLVSVLPRRCFQLLCIIITRGSTIISQLTWDSKLKLKSRLL